MREGRVRATVTYRSALAFISCASEGKGRKSYLRRWRSRRQVLRQVSGGARPHRSNHYQAWPDFSCKLSKVWGSQLIQTCCRTEVRRRQCEGERSIRSHPHLSHRTTPDPSDLWPRGSHGGDRAAEDRCAVFRSSPQVDPFTAVRLNSFTAPFENNASSEDEKDCR